MDTESREDKEEETGGQMTFFRASDRAAEADYHSLIAIAVCAAGAWFLARRLWM